MKKHMLASLFIGMILFISAFPCSAAENTADTLTYENFEYHSNGNGITIDAYFGAEETVNIPAYIGDEQVTEIADYAFLLCNTVVTVNVPESVTILGDKAFSGATKLVNINTVSNKPSEEDGESSEGATTGDVGSEERRQ